MFDETQKQKCQMCSIGNRSHTFFGGFVCQSNSVRQINLEIVIVTIGQQIYCVLAGGRLIITYITCNIVFYLISPKWPGTKTRWTSQMKPSTECSVSKASWHWRSASPVHLTGACIRAKQWTTVEKTRWSVNWRFAVSISLGGTTTGTYRMCPLFHEPLRLFSVHPLFHPLRVASHSSPHQINVSLLWRETYLNVNQRIYSVLDFFLICWKCKFFYQCVSEYKKNWNMCKQASIE